MYNYSEVQIKKIPFPSVSPTNHSKNYLDAEGKTFIKWGGISWDVLFGKGSSKFARNFSTKLFLSCMGVQNATNK